jgi:hypothetical protein
VSKQEFGDWQTPSALAAEVLSRVARSTGVVPSVVLESTCGEGSFLTAAAAQFPGAKLVGYELKAPYVATAKSRLRGTRAAIFGADFFGVDWDRELDAMPGHILVTGNPPWVTNAALGALGSANLPAKRNLKGLSGLDAMTGKSNFDVSEWMILRLIAALQGRRATLALLCKIAVARKVVEFASSHSWDVSPGGMWRIDTMRHFNAAVDAALFVCEVGISKRHRAGWPIYKSLDATHRESTMAIVDGIAIADADAFDRTAHIAGACDPEWRSGLKHDCSRVMELHRDGSSWRNAMGEDVAIEDVVVYPMLKSSDVAKGHADAARGVIVPQHALGEDTSALKSIAPRAWAYLTRHRELLMGRKSSIYRGQPDFAIFGIGPYSFAPWKIAISGMYKRCAFTMVGPVDGRPVMLDDTCYFLPFETEAGARRALNALRSPLASDFFAARIFWDSKRPINKALLQQLDLHALDRELSHVRRAV